MAGMCRPLGYDAHLVGFGPFANKKETDEKQNIRLDQAPEPLRLRRRWKYAKAATPLESRRIELGSGTAEIV